MQYALVNNSKQEAVPNAKGICEYCGEPVFAKCGDYKVFHWAHYSDTYCDRWWEGETPWHRMWKQQFPKEQWEVIINRDGITHRADVQTNTGTIIEFQHSKLSPETIYEREEFYGSQLHWVLDATSFRPDFCIQKNETQRATNLFTLRIETKNITPNQYPFRWINPQGVWLRENQHIVFDTGDGFVYRVNRFNFEYEGGLCTQIPVDTFVQSLKAL